MIRLQETIEVPRPVEDAFAYTSHFGNVAQWDPGVAESVKTSDGPVDFGSTFRLLVKFGPRRIAMDYVITVYEPPHRVVLEGEGGGIRALDDISFTATEQGTRINYTAELNFDGLLGLAEFALKGALDQVGKKAVTGLRKALSEVPPVPDYSLVNTVGDRLILPGLAGFTALGYRWRQRGWQPLAASLRGQTAVVTGATSGLGYAAAEQLAGLGARVILVGRNRDKADQARDAISAATGNTDIAVEIADLSLMAEVRRLAETLLWNEARLHLLINNAGVLLNERTTTAEGIETSVATNLLAPFLLTNLLIPRLRESAPARIINVSSGGMYTAAIDVDNLQSRRGRYNGSHAYARAKRGLVILTELWAKQLAGTGVVVHAMHPGWADTPGVEKSLPAFHKLTKHWLRTPAQGADTIVWLAAAPEVGQVSGRFWLDREPHTTHVFPGTRASAKQRRRLWDALAELTEWSRLDEATADSEEAQPS